MIRPALIPISKVAPMGVSPPTAGGLQGSAQELRRRYVGHLQRFRASTRAPPVPRVNLSSLSGSLARAPSRPLRYVPLGVFWKL
ncbi:unnamed protein product [Boreogadus saida]